MSDGTDPTLWFLFDRPALLDLPGLWAITSSSVPSGAVPSAGAAGRPTEA